MPMSALRTYTRMCLCIWILGRAPREKCFGQTSLKRYWQSTTLRQPELTRGSHLGGLVYKYTLVIQVSADAIFEIHPRLHQVFKRGGQNRTFRHAGRIEKSAARLFVFSALLVN